VPDQELIELYAEARAVYYAPFDEDYGFTAVQALAAAKPLVTTNDAGGVLEFAIHGQNALIAPAEAHAIAAHLDRLWAEPTLAAALGQAGPAQVAGITWDRVVTELVG
jgi:glycosyltransferase involved in cell wall biosynthesis